MRQISPSYQRNYKKICTETSEIARCGSNFRATARASCGTKKLITENLINNDSDELKPHHK